MTELRKGQRVWVPGTVQCAIADSYGDIEVHVKDSTGTDHPVDVPTVDVAATDPRPTYLARREAMVRAVLASKGLNWQFDPFGLVTEADETLRAIDETPVPEWAGGGAA